MAGRRSAAWALVCAVALGCVAPCAEAATEGPATGAAEAPRLHGSGSGRFEVIAEAGPEGVRLAELGEAAWRTWREPFGLPSRLPAAITVRLVPGSLWGAEARRARVSVEAGGAVTVWIRGGGEPGVSRERAWLRALAEGVLARRAILAGMDPARAPAPAWLCAAAAEAALVAERPALLDAWQASMRADEPPAGLREVLLWDGADGARGAVAARGAHGVWLWLREEGARGGAWGRFVGALQAGEPPGAALAREYGRLAARPAEAREWELAWRVAAARLAWARAVPLMEPEETRARIERAARILILDTETGRERAADGAGDWAERGEAWLAGERAARASRLAGEYTRLHPFYRNAAGSLGRAWIALAEGREREWRRAGGEYARDLAEGRELEDASRRLLDEAERAAGR
jgi:hypothetical protein